MAVQVLLELGIDRRLVQYPVFSTVDDAVQAVEELLTLVFGGRLCVVVHDCLCGACALPGVVGVEALGLDRQGLEHEGSHAGPSEAGDGVSLPIVLFTERGIVHPAVDGCTVHANELSGLAEGFGRDQMGDCEHLFFGEFFFGICCMVLHFVAFSLVIVKFCGGYLPSPPACAGAGSNPLPRREKGGSGLPQVSNIGQAFLLVKSGEEGGLFRVGERGREEPLSVSFACGGDRGLTPAPVSSTGRLSPANGRGGLH